MFGEVPVLTTMHRFFSIDGSFLEAGEYDDRAALIDYFYRHADHFMTDFEKRCERLVVAREKAARIEGPSVPRDIWEAEADEAVVRALEGGLLAHRRQILERLIRLHDEGKLQANRCPSCERVLRTPTAKQCRWCHHDWHGTAH